MWYEYPVPTDVENQKRIIRKLKNWIQSLEKRGIVTGFAFNHYSSPPALNIRFDCTDDKLETIRKELTDEVKKYLPNHVLQERLWDDGKSPDFVYKAYEFGSRCAFLSWELADKERFPDEFVSSFLKCDDGVHYEINDESRFNFQYFLNHGLMNSLSIRKAPEEQLIHLWALIESTKSSNLQELSKWIESQPNFFPRKQ